jgi:hypothetical protein
MLPIVDVRTKESKVSRVIHLLTVITAAVPQSALEGTQCSVMNLVCLACASYAASVLDNAFWRLRYEERMLLSSNRYLLQSSRADLLRVRVMIRGADAQLDIAKGGGVMMMVVGGGKAYQDWCKKPKARWSFDMIDVILIPFFFFRFLRIPSYIGFLDIFLVG